MTMLLEAQDLGVCYGRIEAVRGVSIKVEQGAIVTVIGPNGAGKTTLLQALMGCLPSTGTVRYLGEPMARLDAEERVRAGLGLVPERRELFADMSVADNLLLGGFSRRRDGRMGDDLAEVYRRFPRLLERRAQAASTLSGGERQMLALGRALMARPKLLMLDEPSLGLAPLIVRDIFRAIAELKRSGVSILLVEQNARAALQLADYAYVLETGRIVLEGPAAQVAEDRRVIDTYLGLASTATTEPGSSD